MVAYPHGDIESGRARPSTQFHTADWTRSLVAPEGPPTPQLAAQGVLGLRPGQPVLQQQQPQLQLSHQAPVPPQVLPAILRSLGCTVCRSWIQMR